jgi:hypothetical protein
MGVCLGLWFAPVVSGVACNGAEIVLINEVLKSLGCYSKAASDEIYWFFRKKMLLLNIATYVPVAGVPLQLFEVYAIGQFTIHCASRPEQLTNEQWMKRNWGEIANLVFSGTQAIKFYEQSTGNTFPTNIKPQFCKSVDTFARLYRMNEKVPGLSKAQEFTGENMRKAIHFLLDTGPKALGSQMTSFIKKKRRT